MTIENLQSKKEYNGLKAKVIGNMNPEKQRIPIQIIEKPYVKYEIAVKLANVQKIFANKYNPILPKFIFGFLFFFFTYIYCIFFFERNLASFSHKRSVPETLFFFFFFF